ncbi:hypothetical protein P4N68_11215 [Corynebacterium felinum]|uniref:Tellurite resistance protein TerB n=1 Tax=Corynebacterium felinum TaxID=131318 RepID=A0ABU2B7U0_9CORY|nr:hypothetical protein [Corynebacterium felinum]MDF5821644.1 hypothetical protein [Corynebacterium felinum]MDR7354675.1 hypothetical protein [Corynebacterium felinum]WJY94039.1 hypothetical protein CFELI_01985 [Corynebacterium felinum]
MRSFTLVLYHLKHAETWVKLLLVYSFVGTIALVGFAWAIEVDSKESVGMTIVPLLQAFSPMLAATIAWLGVHHTVRNSRKQESLKAWHESVRWACELCFSEDENKVAMGLALLDALDNHPQLEENEQQIIDSAIKNVCNKGLEK